jgi:hypothetical protein
MPKGATFTIGIMSMMLAAGCSPPFAFASGSTVRDEGASPWLHLSFAPFTTSFGTTRT